MIVKKIHLNKPQLRSVMIDAPNETGVMGRGLGKTKIILARKSAIRYLDGMPRGSHVVIGATFTQLLTRTLRELIGGWQGLGYVQNHHFICQKRPSDAWIRKWKWKGPYSPPLDFHYFITWWNGAVVQMISQERVGSSNGLSIDSIIGDEAKYLDEERFNTELMPANRGIIPAFKNNPYHHGVTLTTDMPVGTAGRWILDKANAMDKEVVNQIWQLQAVRFKLCHQLAPNASNQVKKEIAKQVEVIDDELNYLRRGLHYYHEASTLDNIHALGEDYIKQQIRETSQFQFDTQILNIRPLRLEDGFYPDFDENYHGYFKENSTYFDNLVDFGSSLDCRKDADLDIDAALHIGIDYNRRIHPIVVAQDNGKEIRILKGLHALAPGKLKEALKLFVDYYYHHKRKVVYYWYDHTAVGGENETEKCQEVIDQLTAAGWVVIPMYIGKAPGHETKYRMYGHLFQEDGYYSKVMRFNRENCDKLILSIGLSEAEQRKDGFGKDKKSEHDPKFPAEESTHYSDALDMITYGMLECDFLHYDIKSSAGHELIITS